MKILFRTDAGPQIGAGHAMRCCALAQACRDRHAEVIFAMAETLPAITARLSEEGIEAVAMSAPPGSLEDATSTAELARGRDCECVVVDGYVFGAAFQQALKDAGLTVLFVDDNGHTSRYKADYVLNQNLHATPALYPSRAEGTALLLGPHYALLRREFSGWRGWHRTIPKLARKILVTLGGSDPGNATLRTIHALDSLKKSQPDLTGDLEVRILVTSGHSHLRTLEPEAAKGGFQLLINVADVAAQMAQADLAVSAAGSTCYEMAQLGLPACLLVTADNQAASAAELHRRGIFYNLGSASTVTVEGLAGAVGDLLASPSRRQAMSERGQSFVDGRGAERLAAILCERKN